MAGLTNTGFTRKTLTEIRDSINSNATLAFGDDFNTADDSVFSQLSGPFSIELDQLWQQLQASVSAYTPAGAEGVHLDNYYAYRGIGRLAAARATDTLLVGTNGNLVDPFPITGRRFTSSFNVEFGQSLSTQSLGVSNTFAYSITTAELALNSTYAITLSDSAGATQNFSLVITDEASKAASLLDLRNFINTTRPDISSNMILVTEGLYIGFSNITTFNVTASSFNLVSTPFVGTRFGKVDVQSTDIQLLSGRQQDTYQINPSFLGFVSAQGSGAFFAGRNVETDAEYRTRAEGVVSLAATSSSIAIERAIESTTGVVDAVIHENPTSTPTTEVNQAYAIHIIVLGGNPSDIGRAILTNIPLNVSTFGSTAVQVPNEAGTDVTLRYSAGEEVSLTFRIDYDTTDDSLLTIAEQEVVASTIVSQVNSLRLGDDLRVFSLSGAIVAAIGISRLSALTVNVRETTSGTFQTTDFEALFNQALRTVVANISTNKV